VGSYAVIVCDRGFVSVTSHAVCAVNGVNTYWILPVCTNHNECASNPCMNGGVCVDCLNSFVCHCCSPYTGATCSVKPAPVCSWTRNELQCAPQGNNTGVLLDSCFSSVFPNGITIGARSPCITLTTSVAVRNLLSSMSVFGGAGIFGWGFSSITNPTTSSSSWNTINSGGQLLTQLLTAKVNVGLDLSTCTSRYPPGRQHNLGNFIYVQSCTFSGLTVNQIIALADSVISGAVVRSAGCIVTPVQLASALTNINANYDSGTCDRQLLLPA